MIKQAIRGHIVDKMISDLDTTLLLRWNRSGAINGVVIDISLKTMSSNSNNDRKEKYKFQDEPTSRDLRNVK